MTVCSRADRKWLVKWHDLLHCKGIAFVEIEQIFKYEKVFKENDTI